MDTVTRPLGSRWASLRQRYCLPPLCVFSLWFYVRSARLNRFYACVQPSLRGIAQSEMRHSSSLLHRLAVSCLFEQVMCKFSDFDYKNYRNHTTFLFKAQISRYILIFILFYDYLFFTFHDDFYFS